MGSNLVQYVQDGELRFLTGEFEVIFEVDDDVVVESEATNNISVLRLTSGGAKIALRLHRPQHIADIGDRLMASVRHIHPELESDNYESEDDDNE